MPVQDLKLCQHSIEANEPSRQMQSSPEVVLCDPSLQQLHDFLVKARCFLQISTATDLQEARDARHHDYLGIGSVAKVKTAAMPYCCLLWCVLEYAR